MTDSLIPRAQSANEIVKADLLKYSYLAKRQIVRRHVVPAKFRTINVKEAITQLGYERVEIGTNLFVALQNTKLKQDEWYGKEIIKLHHKKELSLERVKKLRRYLSDLNKEVSQWENKYGKILNPDSPTSKPKREDDIRGDMEKTLAQKTIRYSIGQMRQKELRRTFGGLLEEISRKDSTYDALMNKLYKGGRILAQIGRDALDSNKERNQALLYLKMIREANESEERKRREKFNATWNKLQTNFNLISFLQTKRRQRINRHIMNSEIENVQNKINHDGLRKCMKYLVDISGETDLLKITETIENMNYEKESLFRLLLFVELQCTKLENSISHAQDVAASRKAVNDDRHEWHQCRLKKYMEEIRNKERVIKSSEALVKNLENTYRQMCDMVENTCQVLNIRPSTFNPSEKNVSPNEDNILDYIGEMERESYELVVKVNCVENGCANAEHNEDTLTSDGESIENLISKDLNGIEIKMRRLVRM